MEIFTLIYEKKYYSIKLFDPFFINNNKKNCKMIIDNKLFPLTENYDVPYDFYSENKYLKIKLVIFTGHRLNLKKMFFNCECLKEFKIYNKKKSSQIQKEKKRFTDTNFETDNKNMTEHNSYNFSESISFIIQKNNDVNKSRDSLQKVLNNLNFKKKLYVRFLIKFA